MREGSPPVDCGRLIPFWYTRSKRLSRCMSLPRLTQVHYARSRTRACRQMSFPQGAWPLTPSPRASPPKPTSRKIPRMSRPPAWSCLAPADGSHRRSICACAFGSRRAAAAAEIRHLRVAVFELVVEDAGAGRRAPSGSDRLNQPELVRRTHAASEGSGYRGPSEHGSVLAPPLAPPLAPRDRRTTWTDGVSVQTG